jgi:outer membrane receptor protein involved in Fe transport
MRIHDLRPAALSAAIISCIPFAASAQLEEIVVTATRRETDLQSTPLSIQAFTAEQLELGGITNGRDLGIMVPNVVLNPSTGGGQARFAIRGLPGVGLYIDGVWQDGFGFQQLNFDEFERVEVLRGPQGTLFGRNTNGGAVNMTTKRPGDEFGARVKLDVGEFNRRDASIAVDLPLTDTLKTKFIGATSKNDGFIEGLTTPWDFGSQDDTVLRGDILWEPTDSFSLRVTHNEEDRRGTDPKIHRTTRYDNSKTYAYNMLIGAFQAAADAACRAGYTPDPVQVPAATAVASCSPGPNSTWTPPPANQIGMRYTNVRPTAYNPATFTTNFPENWVGPLTSQYGNYQRTLNAAGQLVELLGSPYTPNPRFPDVAFGPGQIGKWQTRSDSMEDGIIADLSYSTVTANWDITDNLNFEAILSEWEQLNRQVIDFDGTEFLITTDDLVDLRNNETMEFHLTGSTPNGRISWIGGYYSLEEKIKTRNYRWGMWEFYAPVTGAPTVNPAGFSILPPINTTYAEYARQTAYLLDLEGFTGGALLTPNSAVGGARYPWVTNLVSDQLTEGFDDDEAWFGEATFSVTEKLDLTVGARFSDKTGGDIRYNPSDAFRTPDPAVRPQGDPFAGTIVTVDSTGAPTTGITYDKDKPTIKTYKFSAAYQATQDVMVYLTYAEGFTSASDPVVNIGGASVIESLPATSCPVRVSPTQAQICLPVEVIENSEIGLRSDWLGGRLRFNATYFDSTWDGMRVALLPLDQFGNTQPFPYDSGAGKGTADGFEFEVIWAPTDRLTLNAGLGLIDTNYIQAGVLTGIPGQASITGNFPGAPFAYAADESGTLGAQYEIPLSNGGQFVLVGNYGYMGDYARDAAYQRTQVDINGRPVLEPAYGILNARFLYEPADRNYRVELWGKNLLDELYVNGGFDTRDTWGYDFSIVGRSREVGVSLSFEF